MTKPILAFCCVVVFFGGCTVLPPDPAPLQIQAFQTKEFAADKRLVFGAAVSVFQDLGYIVQSADLDTGFITAASPAGNRIRFWEIVGGLTVSGQTKATAFIEQVRADVVSVRLNFVNATRISTKEGQTTDEDNPILDPKAYEVAFDKIENAIFVRSAGSTTSPVR